MLAVSVILMVVGIVVLVLTWFAAEISVGMDDF
jgi:hypothetical protein